MALEARAWQCLGRPAASAEPFVCMLNIARNVRENPWLLSSGQNPESGIPSTSALGAPFAAFAAWIMSDILSM